MRVSRVISSLKQGLVSAELAPRTVLTGPFRGLRMNLSLAHESQFYLGLFERETHRWLKHLCRGIATGIDIGAADGEYTLFLLKRTSAKKVHSFEPSAVRVRRLKNNLSLNAESYSERLALHNQFVGAKASENTISLDSLSSEIETPCFIKMDVDGAEADILAGAEHFNRMPGIRWLIETHSLALEDACSASLRSSGFDIRIIPNAWWRSILPEQRPILHNRWLVAWKQ